MRDKVKQLLIRRKWGLTGLLIGAVGGFLYWRFVGCTSGSCPIRSVWYWSTLWGAVAGYLLGDIVNDLIGRKFKKSSNNDGEV